MFSLQENDDAPPKVTADVDDTSEQQPPAEVCWEYKYISCADIFSLRMFIECGIQSDKSQAEIPENQSLQEKSANEDIMGTLNRCEETTLRVHFIITYFIFYN